MCIVQESINDEGFADAILNSDVGKRGHFNNEISLENGNDFKGNDMCNDCVETYCEYNIENQLGGSICHLSEMDEECLDIFSVTILIVMMIIYKLV